MRFRSHLRENDAKLIIVDANILPMNDIRLLRAVSQVKKKARLILCGVAFSEKTELAALSVGVVACCATSLPIHERKKILEVVIERGVWLSSTGMAALLTQLHNISDKRSLEKNNDERMLVDSRLKTTPAIVQGYEVSQENVKKI